MNAVQAPLTRATPLLIGPRQGGGVYRPSDAEVIGLADRLALRLREAESSTVVRVRFEAPLSASAHARVLGRALGLVVRGECPGRFVLVEDPQNQNDYDAEAALEKESRSSPHKLVCVWLGPSGSPRLVGAVDPKVRETYALALDLWKRGVTTTARALAEAEGVTIQSASNRVSKAASLGILCQIDESSVEGGGVQKVYVPVQ